MGESAQQIRNAEQHAFQALRDDIAFVRDQNSGFPNIADCFERAANGESELLTEIAEAVIDPEHHAALYNEVESIREETTHFSGLSVIFDEIFNGDASLLPLIKEALFEENSPSHATSPGKDNYQLSQSHDNEQEAGIDDDPGFDPAVEWDSGISFKHLGGMRNIHEQITQDLGNLENLHRTLKLGGKLPRGILLYGPPGTGKTSLAKAIANEAGMPQINVSATEFDASVHGVSKARMKTLFQRAEETVEQLKQDGHEHPLVAVNIDEIDLIAKKGSNGGGNAQHDFTMTALADLMDGANPASENIIVVASTNRAEDIDPSLLRPGRFDAQFEVPSPDWKGRHDILKIITRDRDMPLKKDVDLKTISQKTFAFSGADLKSLVDKAAAFASQRPNARKVGMQDFLDARDRILKGPRRYLNMDRLEQEGVATHEAGHAIATLRMEKYDVEPLEHVTMLPHIGSLGTTYFMRDKESYAHALEKFKASLVVTYAGRYAEELAYGPEKVTSGASGDIEEASETAWKMVTQFGFNETLGLLCMDVENDAKGHWDSAPMRGGQSFNGDIMNRIYAEIQQIADDAASRAKALLTQDYEALIHLSSELMENEILDREEVIAATGIQPEKPEKNPSLKQLQRKAHLGPPGLRDTNTPSPD